MRECPACFVCYDDSIIACPVEGRQTFNSLPGGVTLDGRYVLEKRLGEGGMGVVYKAHHKFLKTTRAIKIIKPELVGNDPSFSTRFQQEAMAAAAIGHPNIISVPDYGFLDGEIPFLVMEFIEGISLQDLMTSEGRFTPEKALEYMRVIASGVGAAHAHGIVHRDLKPLNIMIHSKGSPQEQIRILDFGLAKIKSADLFGSFVGAKTTGIIGSPYYMAPEQWSDDEPDKRCDIYSLGIILYQMLSGEVPFKGSSIPAVMKKHLMSPPPPLAVKGSGISEGLEKVVYHALEKDPIARTGSAEELIAELERAVAANSQGKRARARTRAKTKVGTSLSKDDPARTTGKQASAPQEQKDVARSTGEQKEALETHESVDVVPLDATELINDSKANETIISGAPVVLRISGTSIQPEKEDKFEVSDSELGDKTSLTGAQPVPAEKEDLPSGNISEPRLDELRKATEEARRRAEERAFRELSESAEAPRIRPTSMPPTLGQLAPEPSKFDPKSLLKKPLVLGAGAAAVIATIVVVLLVVNFSVEPQPAREEASTPTRPQRDMILIKGAGFTMGSETAGQEQRGAHLENVDSFYMDRTEVTNEEYAVFIKATGYRVPTNEVETAGWWKPWNGTDPPKGRERWPVSNVSAKDADAYAQWLSTRDGVKYQLPNEAQWEFAARNGADQTLFPWGNKWDSTRANLNGQASPTAVGSFPTGQTSTGLLDMVGNVWEWTSSRAAYYDSRQINSEEATARVRRGGAFAEKINEHFFNATDRGWSENEDYKFPAIGFRLVRDAP